MVSTGTGRDGNGKPRDSSFPTAICRPFPSLVSVPAVYHPVVRRLVPVPTVSRPTVRPHPDCVPSHRLPRCSHPMPTFAHNFSHPASQYIFGGCYFRSVYHRFSLFLIMDATILCYFEFNSRGIFPSRYSFMCFVMFPLPKRVCFPP